MEKIKDNFVQNIDSADLEHIDSKENDKHLVKLENYEEIILDINELAF